MVTADDALMRFPFPNALACISADCDRWSAGSARWELHVNGSQGQHGACGVVRRLRPLARLYPAWPCGNEAPVDSLQLGSPRNPGQVIVIPLRTCLADAPVRVRAHDCASPGVTDR